MKSAWILLPALLMAGSAQALEVYCDMKGGPLPNGTEFTRDWYVVASTARKPQLPGQTKATTSCSIVYSSLGGTTQPIEIITKPTLGKREQPGTDSITARRKAERIS